MPKRVIHLNESESVGDEVPADQLHGALAGLRRELDLPDGFPAEVEQETSAAIEKYELPERDETAVPFFTIDPEGSTDLDQAMCLERDGEGYRVRYAIADVPAFVEPGGALDAETRRRGQTIYLPDGRVPLHPAELSEDAGSLLPDQVRGAYVWDITLDAAGETTGAEVYRAAIKSHERMDYVSVQQQVDAGTDDERLLLLKEIGEKRIEQERLRGGASLPMPSQEVEATDGGYTLSLRPPVPAEDWNAQISLMTGMVAAEMMLHNRIGILRTMPEPDAATVATFKRAARALGAEWSSDLTYGEFLRTLDKTDPRHLALIYEATSLFRGAGYTAFDGDIPDVTVQAAVAAPYAHVTAPLRRLVDRFGLVICESLCRDAQVPQWVRQALAELPELMKASDSVARRADREATDIVEAAFLAGRIGEEFEADVVDHKGDDTLEVQFTQHAVVAQVPGRAELGSTVTVKATGADVAAGKVDFELV